jgi:hypothetical protein
MEKMTYDEFKHVIDTWTEKNTLYDFEVGRDTIKIFRYKIKT